MKQYTSPFYINEVKAMRNLSTIFFTFILAICSISLHANDNAVPGVTDVPDVKDVPGVTDDEIVLGSILPLEGSMAGIGQKMRVGIEKAINGQMVGERQVRVIYANDLYEPLLTPLRVHRLIHAGIFAMLGNVGTPTATVALPILKQAGIPAIGFFTGSDLLRTSDGLILNYRASYTQEISTVVDSAIASGIKPEQVCAYLQNDGFGKAGLIGLQEVLLRAKAPQMVLDELNILLTNSTDLALKLLDNKSQSPTNNIGPVGIHLRNQIDTMTGYDSLKNWERKTGYNCKLVIAVGTYSNIANFIHTARIFGENWIISSVSFAGANNLRQILQQFENLDPLDVEGDLYNVLMTQVTPPLDSKLPIVEEAQRFLGKEFDFVSLEGYIIGKMTLELLRKTPNPLTQITFLNQAKQVKLDLGGMTIDFTRNGYQGSDLVTIIKFTESGYTVVNSNDWNDMLAWKPTYKLNKTKPETKPETKHDSEKKPKSETKHNSEKKPKPEKNAFDKTNKKRTDKL